MKIELTQGKLLNALSENNSSGKFSRASGEKKIVDIGELRDDNPHRIIVGNQSTMTEIFSQSILEAASNVVVVTMPQNEFYPQVLASIPEDVLDIGYVDKENRAIRTIIATERQIQKIFSNIEFSPDAAK